MFYDKLGGNLSNASAHSLLYYLKSWCKLVAKAYTPTLNQLSGVFSFHTHNLMDPAFTNLLSPSNPANPLGGSLFSNTPGILVDNTQPFLSTLNSNSNTSSVLAKPIPSEIEVAKDSTKLLELCTDFSTSVLQSIVALLNDPSLLDNSQFVKNMKILIQDYKV